MEPVFNLANDYNNFVRPKGRSEAGKRGVPNLTNNAAERQRLLLARGSWSLYG